MGRRQDHRLRAAIDRLQTKSRFIKQRQALFDLALHEICDLADASCGLIIEPMALAQSPNFYRLTQAQLRDFKTQLKPGDLIAVEKIKPLNIAFQTRCPQDCDLNDFAIKPSLALTKRRSSQAILPMLDGERVIACLCLGGTDLNAAELQRWLWPLLTACVCALRLLANHQTGTALPARAITDAAQTLSRMEESCPIGVIEIDSNFKMVHLNPAAEEIFQLAVADAAGRSITHILPERFPNEHRLYTFAPKSGLPGFKEAKFVALRNDGSCIPVEVACVPHQNQGQAQYLLMIQDHSQLEKALAEQQSQFQKFKAVSDLAPVGILQTDKHWKCVYVNKRWCEISQIKEAEAIGAGWINAIHHKDVASTLKALEEAIAGGLEFKQECRIRTRLGAIVWGELQARPITDLKGDMEGVIATLTDITYRRQTEQHLRQLAEFDSLTGLANRNSFKRRLQDLAEEPEKHHVFALLSIDLDGFKAVNDNFGHDAGDKLLQTVAERIRSCVRSDDTAARLGGDEFMVLLGQVNQPRDAERVCANLLRQLAQPFNLGSEEVFISASIGVSFGREGQTLTVPELIKQADLALYRAKESGRNNYQLFSPELTFDAHDRLATRNMLHRALQKGELEIYYQAQASCSDNSIIGTEALLRWHHPTRGTLSPTQFVHALEDTRLMDPITQWMINNALLTHKDWLNRGLMPTHSHVSINVSARQLLNNSIVAYANKALRETGLDGGQVVLEVTESALLEVTMTTKSVIDSLRELGIRIALDDFGTGYGSLIHLKRLPVDMIKIDQSFVKNITGNKADTAICRSMIELANDLNLAVIVEGIETQAQLDTIKGLNAQTYQGYYLSLPTTATDTTKLLSQCAFDRDQHSA